MIYCGQELYHHGILGQRWGVRRYQNKDGSLTPEGRKRIKENTQLHPVNTTDKKVSRKDRNFVTDNFRELNHELKKKYLNEHYDDYLKQNPNMKKMHDLGKLHEAYAKSIFTRDVYEKDPETIRNKVLLIEAFNEAYANATLHDLKIKASPEALEYAKKFVESRKISDAIIG